MCRISTLAADTAGGKTFRIRLLTGEGLDEDLHGCVVLFDLQ